MLARISYVAPQHSTGASLIGQPWNMVSAKLETQSLQRRPQTPQLSPCCTPHGNWAAMAIVGDNHHPPYQAARADLIETPLLLHTLTCIIFSPANKMQALLSRKAATTQIPLAATNRAANLSSPNHTRGPLYVDGS